MQESRNLRLAVGILRDGAAIVADRAGQPIEIAGGQERDAAAHAIAHDSDLAGTLDGIDCCRRIAHHGGPVDLGYEAARVLDFGRRIAAFEIRRHAVKYRRRHRGIAECRKAVADIADVMIDAENLLDNHEAALWLAGRIGAITAELEAVRCSQRNLITQLEPPPILTRRHAAERAQYSRGRRQKQQGDRSS